MMRTKSQQDICRMSARQCRFFSVLFVVLILLPCLPPIAQGQQSVLNTNANTQVSRIHFRFTSSRSFTEDELRSRIALTERGTFVGARDFFSFLPMVTPVGEHPFDPVELQQDVVRLRRFYRSAGFLQSVISYDVLLDEVENFIDITFVVDEGPPITLVAVQDRVVDSSGTPAVPEEITAEWRQSLPDIAPKVGSRLNLHDLPRVEAASTIWWNNHGYPFGAIRAVYTIDSTARSYVLAIQRKPGPRARISTIRVTGEKSVRPGAILRELPFSEGDYYSLAGMLEGRREILSLGLFRRADLTIPEGTTPADTIPISVEVSEGPARLVSGSGGYDSRGGLTAQAEWLHRNFTGDARLFSVSGLAQTGVWATEDIPEILYRATVTLTQPYVFHRRLSLVLGPLIEHRDDYRDQSNAIGFTSSLIYQVDPLRSLALRYQLSDRRIQEARTGEYTSGAIDILTFLSNLAKGSKVLKNSLALQMSYGSLDDISVPRRGYLLRPSTEVTFLPSLNSVEYFRFEIPLFVFYPLNEEFGFATRISVGSILPFGKGVPQGDETATEKFLQLRDVLFTAGGPDDVRGWGSRLLGPKFPDIRVESTAPDTTYSVNGYIPIGGLSRIAGSFEFRTPFPGLGRGAGIALCFDAARIWNPQPEFSSIGAMRDENKFFYGTGLGLLYRLPVGTIRFDLGYKINASYQDLREASDVVNALKLGTPLSEVPSHNSKRYHVHFSISVTF
jgi:outer membrane protein insertion porin family